jgi:hypothetical protein
MGTRPDVVTFIESLMPEKPAVGWSNEGMLEMLRDYAHENPECLSALHEYFKSYETNDIVDIIVKGTIAACLVACDENFHQDVKDFLVKEDQWTESDFDFYEAYRRK